MTSRVLVGQAFGMLPCLAMHSTLVLELLSNTGNLNNESFLLWKAVPCLPCRPSRYRL
jgi:hypothetical protein